MGLLTPSEAAAIARGVYRLREDSVSAVHDRGQTLGCEGLFALGDDGRFEAKSGALFWKKLTGFGYVATGEGVFAGDLLIANRGTQIRADAPVEGSATRREVRVGHALFLSFGLWL